MADEVIDRLRRLAATQEVRAVPTNATSLTPGDADLSNAAAITPQARTSAPTADVNALHAENLRRLGQEPGVPFHEEGLDPWTELTAKAIGGREAQLRYLAKRFGPENVRLNQFNEPVVRQPNPTTGQPEDFPLDSHSMTLGNVASLARFAPDMAMSAVAMSLGGTGILSRAALAALGGSLGATMRQEFTQAATGNAQDPKATLMENLKDVPGNMLANLGMEGLFKAAQIGKGLVQGKGLPNPLANTVLLRPADPKTTGIGLAAAARNEALSGIDPALRPSEVSGIPIAAMLEQYMERKPAGASPMIAGKIAREDASKAFQNWLVDPSTLATDEEVGRRGLGVLKASLEPYQNDVALAKFAVGAEQSAAKRLGLTELDRATAAATSAREAAIQASQQKILSDFRVTDIPTQGVPLSDMGDLLRNRFLQMRDAFQKHSSELYDAFFDNPKAKAPIVSGESLKAAVDNLRADLPAVTKEVEAGTGLFDAQGNEITRTGTQRVPVSTPIRPRLDELSAKLDQGQVSINDLKQIRTDVDNEIKIGEAVPGVREKRLKDLYGALTVSIQNGLEQIKDPQLSQAWKDATTFYRENVGKFTEKNVAKLAREAEQTGSVGSADFAKRAIQNEDVYGALRDFYGLNSKEMGAMRQTTRAKVLADSLGVGDQIDGKNLVRAMRNLRDNNPQLYADAFAGKGNDLLRSAEALGESNTKLPLSEVEKYMDPANQINATPAALKRLQVAQDRLAKEYQNSVVAKFLKGNGNAGDLNPDKFVGFLPQAKLSDVQEVMSRLRADAPDVAEQIERKSVQNLLSVSRRSPMARDTMAKLNGEPGDLISGAGIDKALGGGDQLEKYKAILGDLYQPLNDFAKTETLAQNRAEVAGNVGMLAPGSAMNALIKALTPWEGNNKGKGMMMELGGLARDKIVSIALSSKAIRNWMTTPYALANHDTAIKAMLASEPFLKGAIQEFGPEELSRVMSVVKSAFGIAGSPQTAAPEQPGAAADRLRRLQQVQEQP